MKSMTGDEESMTGCRITSGDKASLEAGTAGCGLQPSVDKWRGELHMNGGTTKLESHILKEGPPRGTKGSHLRRRELELELGIRMTASNCLWNNAGGGRKPRMGWRFISRG